VNRQIATPIAACALIAALALGGQAAAYPASGAKPAPAPATTQATSTANMQGDDSVWRTSPYIHAFYDLTKATYGGHAAKVDLDAYEQKSYAIFRDFGVAMGVGPEHMQDHLKLIPRQIDGIVREDPKVLDSYDNFVLALMGPK
jgi:hypothetical protein